ncbi:MAG: PD-(D/E)XK nuclease family protein, partial [Elusimicrobiaceae bacterium]|nr:PD-(D/E)XK nuclease family protein [Elusimicrobiaceae bacterium]
KFRYVHLIPELPKYYFAFGSILHSVMEFIYDPARQFFPTLAEALVFFDDQWNKTTWEQKGYASVDKELAGYAEGRRQIEAYYAKNASTFTHPLSVEMRSTLEIDGLSLISILDRMDYLGDGLVKILDYKTGKTVQREPDQLYMYQKVVENSPTIKALVQQKDPSVKKIRVGQLAFYHLPTLTEMTFERAPDKEILEFWQKVLTVADNIRAGKFAPTPGENQCRWCDYRNIRPVFTGKEYSGPSGMAALELLKGEILPSPVEKTPQKSAQVLAQSVQEKLSEKIDRYGDLLQETEQLRQEIIDLMQQHQFSQHFGAQYKAELKEKTGLAFSDKEGVLVLLRNYNLLAKTLVPTQSTIAALLEDPSVSADVKERLAKLAVTKIQTYLDVEKAD